VGVTREDPCQVYSNFEVVMQIADLTERGMDRISHMMQHPPQWGKQYLVEIHAMEIRIKSRSFGNNNNIYYLYCVVLLNSRYKNKNWIQTFYITF